MFERKITRKQLKEILEALCGVWKIVYENGRTFVYVYNKRSCIERRELDERFDELKKRLDKLEKKV